MGQVARLKATRRRPTLKTRKHNYGAHDRSRTDDLTLTKGVLYQLSYMGKNHILERVMGIEPTPSAWKAEVLPLNYTRVAPSGLISRRRNGPARLEFPDADHPGCHLTKTPRCNRLRACDSPADGGGGRIRTSEG